MELATGTLPGQAPKAIPRDAWGEFLRRVLVSVSQDAAFAAETRAARDARPKRSETVERAEGAASEQ